MASSTSGLDPSNIITTSRKRKAPDTFDPGAYEPKPVTIEDSDEDEIGRAKKRLKTTSDQADFNAEPSLFLNSAGRCIINTAKMSMRSKIEVWNYAALTNKYLNKKLKKVKSTKKARREQQDFCGAVKSSNKKLFEELNKGKKPGNKMFSVVGHVPDQAISGTQAKRAAVGPSGLFQCPGWLPMTRQANSLVAQLAGKTDHSVMELEVDGMTPNCLIDTNAYSNPNKS